MSPCQGALSWQHPLPPLPDLGIKLHFPDVTYYCVTSYNVLLLCERLRQGRMESTLYPFLQSELHTQHHPAAEGGDVAFRDASSLTLEVVLARLS